MGGELIFIGGISEVKCPEFWDIFQEGEFFMANIWSDCMGELSRVGGCLQHYKSMSRLRPGPPCLTDMQTVLNNYYYYHYYKNVKIIWHKQNSL